MDSTAWPVSFCCGRGWPWARIKSIEQLRYVAPGEGRKRLGWDRIPEVRTRRQKLQILCQPAGRAMLWNTALAQVWIAGPCESELIFYTDGQMRDNGDLTPLPRQDVARERLGLPGTTDSWINALDGPPFFSVHKEVDPGLLARLRYDVVPWLETNAAVSAELQPACKTIPTSLLADPQTPPYALAAWGWQFSEQRTSRLISPQRLHRIHGRGSPRRKITR